MRANSISKHIHSLLASLTISVAMFAGVVCPSAQAQTLLPASGGYYQYFLDSRQYVIGISAMDADGNNYYCRQIDKPTDYNVTETTAVENTDVSRRLAWLMRKYRSNMNVLTHSAIGMLVHRNYDDQTIWAKHDRYLLSVMPGLEEKINDLWELSGKQAYGTVEVVRSDVQGLKSGSIFIQAKNADGQPVNLVYTAVIEGPAVFDLDDEPDAIGTTGLDGVTLYWHATGTGEITINVGHRAIGMDEATTSQKMVTFHENAEYVDQLVTFDVSDVEEPKEREMPQTGSSVGLAIGVLAAACVCGAFMLYAAQRR